MQLTPFRLLATLLCAFISSADLRADEAVLPPGGGAPLLRLETNGPRSNVNGLAFSPDGARLYAVGWDKVVQVWDRNNSGRYEYNVQAALRTPVGPGIYGQLFAMCLSKDGRWLATAGAGIFRELAGERDSGWIQSTNSLSRDSQLDIGLIYVFDTLTGQTKLLRGHRGNVCALGFVHGGDPDVPTLISIAEDRTEDVDTHLPTVRHWDVVNATEIGQLKSIPTVDDGARWGPLPNLKGSQPGLTAWSTGKEQTEVRVALAWSDGLFRVWDVRSGQVATSISSPVTWIALPLDEKRERILTAGNAQIGVWKIPSTERGTLGALDKKLHFQDSQIESLRGAETDGIVTAAAVIPQQNSQPAHAIFVVTRVKSRPYAYRLLITTTTSPIRTVREIELPWKGIRRPSLAVAPDGGTVAIAGNERAEIEVYSTADLIAGKLLPPQRLASEALLFSDAQFVRREKNWGIRLTQPARDSTDKSDSRQLIFNLNERKVEISTEPWRIADVQKTGWSVIDYKTPGKVVVSNPNREGTLEFQLEDRFSLTAIAFCPKPAGSEIPVVAIASELRGEARLHLFNGSTAEQVRRFTGHTETIRSLHFSDDGRMLISASDDRTVSVWTIGDLAKKTLGARGMIHGLSVQEDQGRLIVNGTSEKSVFEGHDEIVAGDRQGEVVEFGSKKDFYNYIRNHRPGDTVSLNVKRREETKLLTCRVDQAIDEVKPLFTLLIVPTQTAGEWEWIGWNPLGYFDIHGERVDRWLGWHFNTGESSRPATFAVVGEYRDQFYRLGLLQELIELQKPSANRPLRPRNPKVSFFLQHFDGTPFRRDYDDVTQLETTQISMTATATGIAQKPSDLKLDVTIQNIESGFLKTIELKHIQETEEWTADLSDYSWSRGPHRLIVQGQIENRLIKSIERVEYRPQAPAVIWDVDPTWKQEIRAAEITVNASVLPSTEEARIQLQLQRPGHDEPLVVRTWDVKEPLTISETVAIKPGENRLEIVAWNLNAPPDDREFETARTFAFARRAVPPAAPKIEVEEEVVGLFEQNPPKVLSPDSKNPGTYQTDLPTVRVAGKIVGQPDIEKAELSVSGERRQLIGAKPEVDRPLKFQETISLKPGHNPVVVVAAAGAIQSEKRLNFVYQPPVPHIVEMKASVKSIAAQPLQVAQEQDVFYSQFHEPVAVVTAKLVGDLGHSYELILRVNDVAVERQIKIDRSQPGAHHLEATIPLEGGTSVVSLQVRNNWNPKSESEELSLQFHRPPEIVAVEAPSKLGEGSFQMRCRIRSAIPLRSTKVVLDDTYEIPGALADVVGTPGLYQLEATTTGISHGKHLVTVSATNDEGSTLTPAVHEVNVEQTTRPPKFEIISPTSATPAPSKQLIIQYAVTSDTPTTIALKCRGIQSGDVTDSSADSVPVDGTIATIPIDLFPGPNEIELTAHNRGGYSEKQILNTSYVPHPATVEIVSIDGKRPQWREGKGILDSSVPKARVKLQGKLKIKDRSAIAQNLKARIWVNGFLQTANVIMDSEADAMGTFSAELTLGRPRKNEIRVEVYGDSGQLPSLVDDAKTVTLDCDKHERNQDLYLMLLGTGNADILRENAMKALHVDLDAKNAPEEAWHSELFSSVHVFSALNVRPVKANTRLDNLVTRMKENRRRTSSSGAHTILMVYFQGKLALTGEDFKFITYEKQSPSEDALTGKDLQRKLNDTYGAHLLFLDLNQTRDTVSMQDIWPKAPQLGIVISNWMGLGEQPDETRLVSALNQALPQIRIVRDLASTIDQRFRSAQQQFPGQLEARVDLLKNVQDVRIGLE